MEDLRAAFSKAWKIRDGLRAEMIALQEEMDWLVYAAYGLIPRDHPACSSGALSPEPSAIEPLAREQRPFVLWQQARGDFEKAVEMIPADWSDGRKALWRARLETIRDNEHIRRIEAPVYKRRWDEQWKVGNRWQCGPVAYDAELVEAFDWWLSEKAEWWLEKEWHGRLARGPADLDTWLAALAADDRITAAWPLIAETLARLGRPADFRRHAAALIKSQAVPADIPWAVPWAELEKTRTIPAAVKRIRGKLNVPRERFRTTAEGRFFWAGA